MSAGCATSLNHPVSEAIIGLDSLLTHATTALYGDIVDPEVDVRRTETPGRYEVDLGFRSNVGMARRADLSALPMFTDPQPAVVMQALGLFARDLATPAEADMRPGFVDGALPLLLELAGRDVVQVFFVGESVDIRPSSGSTLHVTRAAYQLFRDVQVRKGLAALGEALTDSAVTGISVIDRASGNVICSLSASGIQYLRMPQTGDVILSDTVTPVALELVGPVFRAGEHWIFTDGAQTLRIRMCDEQFLKVVDNGIFTLEPGMILIVNLRVRTEQKGRHLVSDYSIIKVVDLRNPATQLPMPGHIPDL